MDALNVNVSIDARLSWDYSSKSPRLRALYEQAKTSQWNATTDIDWSLEVPFGSPLPDDSAFSLAAFYASPLARHGRQMWDTFRWEFQSWMVSQFLHGEQGALVTAARLTEVLPDLDSKYYAASQVVDEARHVEVFSRYLNEKIPCPYSVSSPLARLLEDILGDSRWDVTALGMQLIIEPLAMASFRFANATFHDGLIKQISLYVGRDEARHVSFGIRLLDGFYDEVSEKERAVREDFILEAAYLMSERFLLGDVWERIGIDADEGMAFALNNEMMVAYRQAIFTKVVSSLSRIGFMTERVREGFGRLNLLGQSGRRLAQLSRRGEAERAS